MNAKRKQEKKELKRENIGKKVLLDKDLDPKQLWKDATKLVNAGNAEEAAWNFLLSLFLDPSMNTPKNLPLARKAVNLSPPASRVAKALSIMTHHAGNPILKSRNVVCSFIKDKGISTANHGVSSSLKEVDRDSFACGTAFVFGTRFLSKIMAGNSSNTRTLISHFSQAKDYLNPEQWLIFQYELGCRNVDVLALDEASHWLGCFLRNLEEIEKKGGALPVHLKKYKKTAEQKLDKIPTLR